MKTLNFICIALLTVTLVGCHADKAPQADFFTTQQDRAQWNAIADQQAIAAARADASLYSDHFTGSALNSLGRQELDLLIKDKNRASVTPIYLADSADSPSHRAAVNHYLVSHGWTSAEFTLRSGRNPAADSPAKHNLDDLDKLNSGTTAAAPLTDTGSTGASAVSASKQ